MGEVAESLYEMQLDLDLCVARQDLWDATDRSLN